MTLESAAGRVLLRTLRASFVARRMEARLRRRALERAHAEIVALHDEERRAGARKRNRGARNVLFITVDQQRWDALGCNGGTIARTPCLDALAAAGLRYEHPHVQNVVCMPSRATMLTGRHPRSHGVIANGVALPEETPNVARVLRSEAGYRTALIGKAHFDPHLDPLLRYRENALAAEGSTGPFHGFDHVELATHGPLGGHHYSEWLWDEHPEDVYGFGGVLTGAGGGVTGAPEVKTNPIARERYHTDWVADRTIAYLRGLEREDRFFCWMSFPDPHHPFDPPADEVSRRIDFRDLPLPPGRPQSREIEAVLSEKPRHWLDWFHGRYRNPEGGPIAFVPAQLRDDQLREMNAMIHVENELIDEAIARVIAFLEERSIADDTDVFFTSDHGELQGDFGLFFKGPYHVDALLRVPLIWRPGRAASVSPCAIAAPVGLVDLAPTFCAVAKVKPPAWMEGQELPTHADAVRPPVLTTFDSQFASVGMHLRTMFDGRYLCTAYERSNHEGGAFPLYWAIWGRGSEVPRYSGSEGELYDCVEDPLQRRNLWSDPSRRRRRDELVADLYARLPKLRSPMLKFTAPT